MEKFGGEDITKCSLKSFENQKPGLWDFSFIAKRGLIGSEIHELGKQVLCRDIKETLFKLCINKFNEK